MKQISYSAYFAESKNIWLIVFEMVVNLTYLWTIDINSLRWQVTFFKAELWGFRAAAPDQGKSLGFGFHVWAQFRLILWSEFGGFVSILGLGLGIGLKELDMYSVLGREVG